jgi:hypothetical protein
MFDLAAFWEQLLSEDPAQVRTAFGGLSLEEQVDIAAHLERMATEAGWAEVQKQAAQSALRILELGGTGPN